METIVDQSAKPSSFCMKFSHLLYSCKCYNYLSCFFNHRLILQLFHSLPSFCIHLAYFIFFSLIGFFLLEVSSSSGSRPSALDLFFTSVSAVSGSSMSTVELEVFSNFQLVILTILMLIGGEVFLSLVNLQFSKKHKVLCVSSSVSSADNINYNISSSNSQNITSTTVDRIELGLIQIHDDDDENTSKLDVCHDQLSEQEESKYMEKSIKCLIYTITAYFLAAHVLCSILISFYIKSVPSAKQILENKGIKMSTFSVFTAVSSFSNCGFIPTKENMMVFKKNSGLLLILIPQCLVGNTLYPTCLLLFIFVLKTCTNRPEFDYILSHHKKMGYCHLMSKQKCCYLAATVVGFILIQFAIFVSMEWNNSAAMEGLNAYEKIVGSLFQVTNTRHTGESVFDLSIISPAVLVLFVTMMYLPPYTTFLPITNGEKSCSNYNTKITCSSRRRRGRNCVEYLLFPQPIYLVIFIILICISERKSLKEDPLNFNVLNIILEVTSAYGNVGFSMGYSCERELKRDAQCIDAYYGFAGRWSATGKWILIVVMLFGRLKYFHGGRAKAWN